MQVNFREGQDVRTGDLLVRIDPRPYQAVLDQAKREYAERMLSRDIALFDKRVLDQQALDLQKATVTQLVALVKADETSAKISA